MVVGDDVPGGLVEHREERAERTQSREVHDMLQLLTILQALTHKTIGHKVRLKNSSTVTLDLQQPKPIVQQNTKTQLLPRAYEKKATAGPDTSLLVPAISR